MIYWYECALLIFMMGSAFFLYAGRYLGGKTWTKHMNRMLCSSWLLNLPTGGDHYSSVNDLGTHWNFAAYLVLFVVLFSVIFISFLLLLFFFFFFPGKVETTKCLRKQKTCLCVVYSFWKSIGKCRVSFRCSFKTGLFNWTVFYVSWRICGTRFVFWNIIKIWRWIWC